MIYDIKRTTQFKKDVKLMLKQGRDIQALLDVVELLRTDTSTPVLSVNASAATFRTLESEDCIETKTTFNGILDIASNLSLCTLPRNNGQITICNY